MTGEIINILAPYLLRLSKTLKEYGPYKSNHALITAYHLRNDNVVAYFNLLVRNKLPDAYLLFIDGKLKYQSPDYGRLEKMVKQTPSRLCLILRKGCHDCNTYHVCGLKKK